MRARRARIRATPEHIAAPNRRCSRRNTPTERDFSSSATVLQIPVQSVRVGFPLSQTVSLEPALMLSYVDGGFGTSLAGDLAMVLALSANRAEPQWYARPFVGIQHVSNALGGDHAALGVGAGVRIPTTDRIATRIEGRFRYLTKNSSFSSNELGLHVGLSFFTH